MPVPNKFTDLLGRLDHQFVWHPFTQMREWLKREPIVISLDRAYHGDTIGAVSVGHIDLFHKSYSGLLFKADRTPPPYCYRCPHNQAKPERRDARDYRKCNEECLNDLEQKFRRQRKK